MIVVENAMHAERSATWMVHRASHFPEAFDTKLLAALVGRWKQDFNPNIRSDRGTITAENQCAIKGYIACEAACRPLGSVIPMKNYR
jgi:hypothetical protein